MEGGEFRSRRFGSIGRGRGVALSLFTALLLAVTAVPVLAAEESAAPSTGAAFTPPTPEEEEIAAAQVPGAADISRALGEFEREEAERLEWLAGPEAVQQREASWLAFADISAGESEELLRTLFAEQLAILNSDPSRFLSDAQLVRPIGDSGAVVEDEGDGSLLESPVPVRTEDERGDLAKVDLTLEATPEGFRTVNALAELVLPGSADEAIRVGEDGFEIAQAGAAGSPARRFGDKNLLYPEVLPDTDLLVAGNSFGAELLNLLRSKDSPEALRFAIDVPPGAELRSDGRGGAEVAREDELLTRIPKPWALDAQGTDVPVQLEVEGRSIVLRIAHRGGDYAHPILLDPIVEDWANTGNNWYEGKRLEALTNGAWKWSGNNSSIYGDVCCWGGSKLGLLVHVKDAFYGPEQFGQWSYSTANEKVYIPHAWITPFWRADNGCSSAQPHDYAGLWNPGGWWNPLLTNYAKNQHSVSMDGIGQALVIGEGTGPPGVWLSCWRSVYAGGVAIWLDDVYGPVINSAGVPSGGWFGDQAPLTIDVGAHDEGLGVQWVKILNEGKGVVGEKWVDQCTGLYGSRCPTTKTVQFAVTGDSFGEGIRNSSVTVHDPTGKTAESFFQTKVDNSVPEVALEGQLAEATGEEVSFAEGEPPVSQGEDKLKLPVYKLNIKAKDGALTNDKAKRSGVKDIRVFLDGKEKEVPWQALPSCPQTSCEMDVTYTLALSEIDTAGKHKLEVKAEDFVGEFKLRQIEFEYFPATGMKDEYVMHYFALPDGQGNEDEEEHPARPELAVNVMNGNLVYRERDIDVEGPAVDLEVERFYNSQLPDSESTEWGDGWTLAQTPDLKPIDTGGSTAPDEAELRESSGSIARGVELPSEAGAETFDPALQATLTKTSSGGYELTDETGESSTSVVFDETGRTEARLTEGYAKVDYTYEGSELAGIAVYDPGSAGNPTEPPEEEPGVEDPGDTPLFDSSFGSNGSGDGQLKSPADVAIDAQGNIWLADKGNHRIQKFNAKGEYLFKFGGYGSANGQLSIPTSLAIDAQGNIWVTERGNHRLQKFSPSGEFLAKFGSYGTGNGQFNGPEGVAIDPQGNIWVSDTYNGRVQKFTADGEFIKVVGSKGSAPGQIGEATGIDIGPGGRVWIADWQNNRVSVFDQAGQFLFHFGVAGTGNGQFNRPDAIDADAKGNVWVGDQNNGRVQRFTQAGLYVDQFGAKGSGPGQFSFTYPMGIATDDKGGIWVTDVNNHRVQKWAIPAAFPTYTGAVYADATGAYGSGDGQLKSPADVAIDAQGDIWVADRENNRIQKLNAKGEYLAQFGSLGSEDGQLNAPSALAIDAQGDIWVADRGNNRIQKFSSTGEYLAKFDVGGFGDGKLFWPSGIAIDAAGTIWVSDYNKVQKFTPGGEFIARVGTVGSGPGQLSQPRGIDITPAGEVFIADSANHRVSVFSEAGAFLRQFGSQGAGNGQFNYPSEVEVDAKGNVWVGDRENHRVQILDEEGTYITQFGAKGSEEGQLSLATPMGIATDGANGAWITDTANHRLQKWVAGTYVPDEEPLEPDDPAVEVDVSEGLVGAVKGDEAGEHDYAHTGDLLTAHAGPQGETSYEYDAAGRMTKVTLPNGTWASIKYEALGRVKEVAVSVEGSAAKTTYFTYKDDSPRRTTVEPPDAPHIVYDIGDDGSVLKWWNTQQPPELDLAGTLYDNREKEDAIWSGDHWLDAEALSEEGIASIYVIVNGTTVVDEMTCQQDFEVEGKECQKVINEWVTETGTHAPGHLQIEVIATDTLEHSTSERFWVDIPPPPPPLAPGTPIPPKFRDIAEFREEYGLEVVFPVANEIELNERIFDLIKAWHEPNTPAGQVARASMERWGVPLRPADVAELEYREWFYDVNGERIDRWVEESAPGNFAGYYMDHKAGGIMHVGFTENQAVELENLKATLPLVAGERLQVYAATPTTPYLSLEATSDSIGSAIESNATLRSLVTSLTLGESDNQIHVGALDVAQVESILNGMFGSTSSSIVVDYLPRGERLTGRFRNSGRMRAGDSILNANTDRCTAGFGAYDKFKVAEKDVLANFVLTAGHCYGLDELVLRSPHSGPSGSEDWRRVGVVKRRAYGRPEPMNTDAEAIRIDGDGIIPRGIFGWGGHLIPTGPATRARVGNRVCFSGATTQVPSCGNIVARERDFEVEGVRFGGYLVEFDTRADHGDSGAPVWNSRTGASVGLVTGGNGRGQTLVEPLLHPPRMNDDLIPGILHNKWLKPLHLKQGG